jgi:hypothetical protein
MLAGNVIAPIECLVNDKFRNIPVEQKSALQFKSRIINGTFTRGYCHPYVSGADDERPPYFLKPIDIVSI